jgi:hypothetical protein
MTELTVILKDPHRTYRQKFLIYESYVVAANDLVVRRCVEEAMRDFEGDPESIQVKVHLEVQ